MIPQNFFGSDAQQALLRKGASAYQLFRDHADFTYYGRTVGITSLQEVPLDTLVALSRLQGNSTLGTLTKKEAKTVVAAVEAQGLSANLFARWSSTAECLDNARSILASRKLPNDLALEWLSTATPDDKRQSLADLALSVGVLPPNMSVLTGEVKPGICAMAVDEQGKVVSSAAAAMYTSDKSSSTQTPIWWGMLATREDQRGRGLSMYLGAAVMIEMANRFGYSEFFTGVTPGNAPSEAVCARMALVDDGTLILSAVDPTLMPGGRMTK